MNRINRAIESLGHIPLANAVPRGHRLLVCEAPEAEWNAFLADEYQILRSSHLEWIDGRIYIVEFPHSAHGAFCRQFCFLVSKIPGARRCLASRGGAYLASGPRYEADESFGPMRGIAQSLGIPLPPGISCWGEYMTLKVEVGVSRGWGLVPGSLDWKATQAWPRVPGVAFVLCIAVDCELQRASYKVYELPSDSRRFQLELIDTPIEVQAPSTRVQFDARRLLGLPDGSAPPPDFADPLVINLFAALEKARDSI